MTLSTALAESCDTWFYRLGDRIYTAHPAEQGASIQQWARKLGLGRPTGIDVIGESSGLLPTPAWFRKTQHQPWYEGQTINLAIGQGMLQASPLQMAVAYSALANGGTVVTPHVAGAVLRGASVQPLEFKPARKLKLTDVQCDPRRPLPGGALARRHLRVALRELSGGGRGQDRDGGGAARRRPLLVRLLGPVRPPEGRRRRDDRARWVRRAGGRARGEGDLQRVLPREDAGRRRLMQRVVRGSAGYYLRQIHRRASFRNHS